MAPSIVVRRAVYEELGGFRPELIHSADWEMWRRIAARYSLWYEPRPLACYRVHRGSDTSRLMRTGANIADARQSIALVEPHLPEKRAEDWTREAYDWTARFAARTARRMARRGDVEGAMAQIREGLLCSPSTPALCALVEA